MRTFETYYSLGVAEGDELVGPDARMSLRVVDQTRVALGRMRFAVDAFDVISAAAVTIWVHAELVLATRTANWRICKKDRR